ncbi:MAG: TldD/PmbA family protein [Elusimicrobia bacterium]|nr:TldD/PmbA family protein [Elusimicrobiota bacterium]
MLDLAKKAIEVLNFKKADFGDIRIIDERMQFLSVKNSNMGDMTDDISTGFGIRVLYKGGWGFASGKNLTAACVKETALKALEIAKASSQVKKSKTELAYEPAHKDYWQTPYLKDPFCVPLEKKLELLFAIDKVLMKDKRIRNAYSRLKFIKTHKWYASTEGSEIEQVLLYSGGFYKAVSADNNQVQQRSFPGEHSGALGMGWELIEDLKMLENAEKIREDAVALLTAPQCPSGVMDLILQEDQLALQIHESVGHATELDRVLGYEESYAGSSFATTEKLGKFRYASEIVNLVGDGTLPGGLATQGYDDDGVRSKRWHIVKNGILNGYATNREFCGRIGQKESMSCNRADSFASIPITRIPNLSLMPGNHEYQEMIEGIKNGIILSNNKSWSIDQKRLNFQFGCEYGTLIKNGKVAGMVKNPVYQGITPKFWNSCDAIANHKYWKLYGVSNCGKGQPTQISRMCHASSPARFRKVKICM